MFPSPTTFLLTFSKSKRCEGKNSEADAPFNKSVEMWMKVACMV